MKDDRAKMLIATIKKLYHREAKHNIQKILAKTHVADVATIIEGFEPGEAFDLLKMESSIDRQSEILSHLEPELQKDIISCMSQQEVLALVNRMESDDAADLLGQMPEEEAGEILSSMVKEDSEEVADLMGYPEDTAGSLMSSDYLALNQKLTMTEAIKGIQDVEDDIGAAFYVYVVNDSDQLIGVVSLKQILLAKKSATLKSLMSTDVISVRDDTSQEIVAKTVEHYDFLSIPVVDQGNHLVGVITVDDVIDVIREEAEENLLAMGQAGLGVDSSTFERIKARLGWLMFSFLGGVACFAIVFFFGSFEQANAQMPLLWVVAAFVPLLLSIGATTGSQAATVTVGALRAEKLDSKNLIPHLIKELRLSLVFMTIFGILILLLSNIFLSEFEVRYLFSIAMALQIAVSMILGNLVPLLIARLGLDPSVASIPVYATFADVSAMAVLFALFHAMVH